MNFFEWIYVIAACLLLLFCFVAVILWLNYLKLMRRGGREDYET